MNKTEGSVRKKIKRKHNSKISLLHDLELFKNYSIQKTNPIHKLYFFRKSEEGY